MSPAGVIRTPSSPVRPARPAGPASRRLSTSFALACLFFIGLAEGASPPRVGDQAPLFTLRDLQGREVALASFRGRPVLLHFWATWCPLCREEMPLLDETARDASGRIAVLGINLGERKDKVAAYVEAERLGFPMLLDGRGKVAARYRVIALPATIVVDAEGRIARVIQMGALNREGLKAILDQLAADGEERSSP